ncbi:MAG: putative membrane protein YdjX (TVP38/TMEM64 family) [Myxococcota bacterium]|jgi:uncharacterized membrane protein YdjX (TVP38/TMEM64 family)
MPRRAVLPALLLLAVAAIVGALPVGDLLVGLAEGVARWGTAGILAFGGVYALGCVVFVPRAGLNLLAGWLFGGLLGTAVAVVASVIGSVIAFVIGRHVFFDTVEHALNHASPLRRLDVVARRHPIRLTLLWHLSLVLPFALINYYMGAIRVPLRDFLTGKIIGVIPATAAYVWIGTLVPDLIALVSGELPERGQQSQLFIAIGGVVVTLATLVWIGRTSGRALRQLEG